MSKAQGQLTQIFDGVVESHLPVRITGRCASAILVRWEDWQAIEQTVHRLSTPRMARTAS